MSRKINYNFFYVRLIKYLVFHVLVLARTRRDRARGQYETRCSRLWDTPCLYFSFVPRKLSCSLNSILTTPNAEWTIATVRTMKSDYRTFGLDK